MTIPVGEVEFVKELYPRLREDDAAIERYRAALDKLPPITVARGRVLVDGFHRWQAHKQEGSETVAVEDLGNLTDAEIVRESITRNATHGQQLSQADKQRNAKLLWRILEHIGTNGKKGDSRIPEIAGLLSVSEDCIRDWTSDVRAQERAELRARAFDLWLDCLSDVEIGQVLGASDKTVKEWRSEFSDSSDFSEPPSSRQHFDVWSFQSAEGESRVFGRMPLQVVENLLWLYTEPGQTVVDPFAGGGTTIDVAKAMGRRVWASDLNPATPTLPIHEHDITAGWPKDAPAKADLILLDPPYWQQAKGRYSNDKRDLGNQTLDEFMGSWGKVLDVCSKRLTAGGRLAFIISPSVDGDAVVDHAFDMYAAAVARGLAPVRRIIVTYQTQQATGQQVEWAREKKQLLKLYRDLVVMG